MSQKYYHGVVLAVGCRCDNSAIRILLGGVELVDECWCTFTGAPLGVLGAFYPNKYIFIDDYSYPPNLTPVFFICFIKAEQTEE